MGRRNFVMTDLYCTECYFKMTIPRKESLQKEEGHIKHMNCPRCKQVRPFEEKEKDSTVSFWEDWHNKRSD